MSTREKNLILMFLSLNKNDRGCVEKFESIISKLSKLSDELGIKSKTPQSKAFADLEQDIFDLFDMTKDTYFTFGANANEVIETCDLDWTLEKMEEIRTKANEKAA